MKKKIFLTGNGPIGWMLGAALCEDGVGLAQHLSSSCGYLWHDLGLTSDRKHEIYSAHCPEGYELIDLICLSDEELEANVEFMSALQKNKELESQLNLPFVMQGRKA